MWSGKLEYKLRSSESLFVRRLANKFFSLRNFLFKKLAAIISFLLRLLPVRLNAMIKERMPLCVYMPYKENVKVTVDSNRELRRAAFCYREPETVEWIEECALDGGTLYDVGANIGAVSLIYAANVVAKEGFLPEGSVLCFEPLFSTFKKLCENVVINNWNGGILPFSMPLSSKVGKDIIKLHSIESGSSGHALSKSQDASLSYELDLPVITLTIDYMHYELGFNPPKWLKIDVDGHDYEVLIGAERLIEEGYVKSILIEENNDAEKIRQFMNKYGFIEKIIYKDGETLNLRFER